MGLKHSSQRFIPLRWSIALHTGTWPLQKSKRDVPNLIHCNRMKEGLGESGVNTQDMTESDQALCLVEKPGWSSHSTTCVGSGF